MALLSLDVLRSTDCHLTHLVEVESWPAFYASYVQAVYRYRTQLFTHSPIDGFTNTVCAFLNIILGRVSSLDDLPLWSTRVELLSVLLDQGGYLRSNPQEMLSNLTSQAIAVLGVFHPLSSLIIHVNYNAEKQTDSIKPLAVQSLSTITRIDYDIVKPFIPQILSHLLVLPIQEGAYIEFLDLLLECHIKTRSLDDLVRTILNSISQASFSPQRQIIVVEDDPFLDRLGNAIASFGSVGQCMNLIASVADFIKWALKKLDEEECVGLKFELGAKVVCVVLGCLNSEMVDGEALGKLRARVDRKVKRLVSRLSLFEKEERELERGLCALLRVKYVFDRDVFVEERDEAGLMRLLEGEESLLPGLVFELVSGGSTFWMVFDFSAGSDDVSSYFSTSKGRRHRVFRYSFGIYRPILSQAKDKHRMVRNGL